MLHPLLTHTQLRSVPYKRQQILRTLESLVAHAEIREINATTKRLVERCLGASWAVELKKEREANKASAPSHSGSISSMSTGTCSPDHGPAIFQSSSQFLNPVSAPHPLKNERYMKYSKSVDVIAPNPPKEGAGKSNRHDDASVKKPKSKPSPAVLDLRRGSNESSLSLFSLVGAVPAPAPKHSPASPATSLPPAFSRSRLHSHSDSSRKHEPKRHSLDPLPSTPTVYTSAHAGDLHEATPAPATPIFNDPPVLAQTPLQLYDDPAEGEEGSEMPIPIPIPLTRPESGPPPRYRPAPAPPAKRRKPPAVPSRSTKALVRDAGGTITTIASSKRVPIPVPSPLSRVG